MIVGVALGWRKMHPAAWMNRATFSDACGTLDHRCTGDLALRRPLGLRADVDQQRPAADGLERLGRPDPLQALARGVEDAADRAARRSHHWPAISAAARTSRPPLTANRSMVVSGGE